LLGQLFDWALGLPYVSARDRVPFGVEQTEGSNLLEGAVAGDSPLTTTYTIRCGQAGVARFEGVRLELADLQGFFYQAVFLREVVVFRVLTPLFRHKGQPATSKISNLLPPPGIHRLRSAGSGSE